MKNIKSNRTNDILTINELQKSIIKIYMTSRPVQRMTKIYKKERFYHLAEFNI